VFLVSHDRTFLDNVVTSAIAYEGDARWREYEGGVSDWLTQSKRASDIAQSKGQKGASPFNYGRDQTAKATPATAAAAAPLAAAASTPAVKARKLSFKEQRELDGLPQRIADLETEQKAIADALADGTLFAKDNARALEMSARNAQIDEELLLALERWEVLGAPA
jgi:ATP-binding cassette subfamily F protein uup